MLACLDVDYTPERVCAACVTFADWGSAEPIAEYTARVPPGAAGDYVPGEFYKRELPALLAVLAEVDLTRIDTLIVDGYVWLGAERPGLGKHLYAALQGGHPVVGVAKNPFAGNTEAAAIHRGDSLKPLYITVEGCDLLDAAARVKGMHGPYRFPTQLRRADQACRAG